MGEAEIEEIEHLGDVEVKVQWGEVGSSNGGMTEDMPSPFNTTCQTAMTPPPPSQPPSTVTKLLLGLWLPSSFKIKTRPLC